jgi:hypothetical protein
MSQTITLIPDAPATAVVGASYDFTATATSGDLVTVTTGNPDVCAVADSQVSFLAPGACEIVADQPGNDDYLAAPTVTANVNVVTPVETDLAVTAKRTADIGGLYGATATVTGLPQGYDATLMVSAPNNWALRPEGAGGACTKLGPVDYECLVTPDRLDFVFAVNTHKNAGRGVTFQVEPNAPLTDTNEKNNKFTLPLP